MSNGRVQRAEPKEGAAGVRITRGGDGADLWNVGVRIVALSDTRALDVARATRAAVEACPTSALPRDAKPARVNVTVTGLVRPSAPARGRDRRVPPTGRPVRATGVARAPGAYRPGARRRRHEKGRVRAEAGRARGGSGRVSG